MKFGKSMSRTSRVLGGVSIPAGVLSAVGLRAWAVDSDGDGRHQELTTSVDPVQGLRAAVHAWTTVPTDAELDVQLNVESPGSAGFRREYMHSRANCTTFSAPVVPIAWMQSGDRLQLVAGYRTDSGALIDTETLEVTVP